jgi:enoyl-CoA hydratase/carnithine racemase
MEYPSFEALKLEKRGSIAIVTLNRPEHRNAMLMHGGHKAIRM